jgi:hypothetical protein
MEKEFMLGNGPVVQGAIHLNRENGIKDGFSAGNICACWKGDIAG